jgi:hypothetical protein
MFLRMVGHVRRAEGCATQAAAPDVPFTQMQSAVRTLTHCRVRAELAEKIRAAILSLLTAIVAVLVVGVIIHAIRFFEKRS